MRTASNAPRAAASRRRPHDPQDAETPRARSNETYSVGPELVDISARCAPLDEISRYLGRRCPEVTNNAGPRTVKRSVARAAARKLRRQKYWFFITPKNAAIYRPLGHSHNREGDSGLIAGKMKVCENMLKRVLPRRIIAHSSPARSRRSVSAGQQAIRHLATPLTTDGAARVRQSPLGDSSHHRSAVLTCA